MFDKMNSLSHIFAESAPVAWKDFKVYAEKFNSHCFLNDFTNLPFEMQLGIYLSYLQENNVEIDLINQDMVTLEQSIKEAFIGFEKVIGHYS
jgi:hypothetical protein